MLLFEEMQTSLSLEVRNTSNGVDYFEAVANTKDIESLNSVLIKHLGPAAKGPKENARFPQHIKKIVEFLGGLRVEQSFYYIENGDKIVCVALWPWQSDPAKITIKAAVIDRNCAD